MRSLGLAVFMFGVTDIVIVGHTSCRMAMFKNNEFVDMFRKRGVHREAFGTEDLREWAGAIQDPARGVQLSMNNVAAAPYLPRDVRISGLVLDDTTGHLTVVARQEAKESAEETEEREAQQLQQPQQAQQTQKADEPAAAAPALDEVMAGLDHWIKVVETKAAWKKEVQILRKDLAAQPGAIARLKRLEAFARKASGESKEMIRIFDQIKGELKSVPDGKIPESLSRFLQKLQKGSQ